MAMDLYSLRCNLHGACGGKACHKYKCTNSYALQSARSVWRQRLFASIPGVRPSVAICTERVEAKSFAFDYMILVYSCNLHGACGGKVSDYSYMGVSATLQSARSVWRQRVAGRLSLRAITVAICTERVEAKPMVLTLPPTALCCNLHGACGGKALYASPF